MAGNAVHQVATKGWRDFSVGEMLGAGAQGAAGGLQSWGIHRASLIKTCFTAEMPLLLNALGESKPIVEIRVDDQVLSRHEDDPQGELALKLVEEKFVRVGRITHLHAGGEVLRTTAEHPFWAQGKGWVRADELERGDRLLSHDGKWVEVEEVFDTGEYETVYNLRVADYHTYFVGCEAWGWSVWAHNQYTEAVRTRFEKLLSTEMGQDFRKPVNQRLMEIGRLAATPEQGEAWVNHWTKAELAKLPNKANKALARIEKQRRAMGLPDPDEIHAARRAEAAQKRAAFSDTSR